MKYLFSINIIYFINNLIRLNHSNFILFTYILNSDNQSDTIGETDKQAPKEDQEAKSQADGVLNYKSGHIWFQDNDTEIFTDIQYDQYNNSSEELTYSKKCK